MEWDFEATPATGNQGGRSCVEGISLHVRNKGNGTKSLAQINVRLGPDWVRQMQWQPKDRVVVKFNREDRLALIARTTNGQKGYTLRGAKNHQPGNEKSLNFSFNPKPLPDGFGKVLTDLIGDSFEPKTPTKTSEGIMFSLAPGENG